ncbi:MAG: hypothetical protein IJL57_05665 [Bacteroidales bacterium]|nr:hypothetical protein [Bacteroidales bacterium]
MRIYIKVNLKDCCLILCLNLSPYPSGTYLVKINFERGVSMVRKVVKS